MSELTHRPNRSPSTQDAPSQPRATGATTRWRAPRANRATARPALRIEGKVASMSHTTYITACLHGWGEERVGTPPNRDAIEVISRGPLCRTCTRIPPRHRSRRTRGDCRLAGPRAVRHRHVGRDAHRVQDAGIVVLTLRL